MINKPSGDFRVAQHFSKALGRIAKREVPCRCSDRVPFGAYSNTIILVKGSSCSQYPIRLMKFLWFTRDNVSTCTTQRNLCMISWETTSWLCISHKPCFTFFRKHISERLDHSLSEAADAEITAISTPLESVPLYMVHPPWLSIMLLNSSHAVSSSFRFRFGTPKNLINPHLSFQHKVLNSLDVISPVTKAFCSCPLIPVFLGPMLATALLRQMQIMIATIINKRAAPVAMSTCFHTRSKDTWLLDIDDRAEIVGEPVAPAPGSSNGDGTGAEGCSVCLRDTAGTAPLLYVNGAPAVSGGGTFGAGAAARLWLLESWISLRCRKLASARDSLVCEAPALNLRLQSNIKSSRFLKNIALKISRMKVEDHYDFLQLQGIEKMLIW